MQLRFTAKERNLIAVALGHPSQNLRRREVCRSLLDKLLSGDLAFGFDEIEDLADVMREATGFEELKGDEKDLQTVVDKLTEAMAMA